MACFQFGFVVQLGDGWGFSLKQQTTNTKNEVYSQSEFSDSLTAIDDALQFIYEVVEAILLQSEYPILKEVNAHRSNDLRGFSGLLHIGNIIHKVCRTTRNYYQHRNSYDDIVHVVFAKY